MKTLRIALFLIFGAIITLHSYAQEVKKENKTKFRMEVIDNEGNKKVIDTTFTFDSSKDYSEILRQIKEQAGFSEEEIAKMKSAIKGHIKHFDVDMEVMGDHFDKDSLHKHMMVVREELNSGKEKLENALLQLKEELESMKMNEGAMEKLEKAMEELQNMEWNEHAKHLKTRLNDMHDEFFDQNMNVFVVDGNTTRKHVWVDDDGEKRIVIKTDIDVEGDSLLWNSKEGHIMIFIGDNSLENEDDWVGKKGEKLLIKKLNKDGNTIFFGDDADLELIEELDGDQKVIIKKLKEESEKGDAIFISDDAHIVKEFKDEDGHVKVMRYMMLADEDGKKNIEVNVEVYDDELGNHHEKMIMISPASEEELALASDKGVFDQKLKILELNDFIFNIDNETTSIGSVFEKKGKLTVQLFDSEMNQIWEENAGKVVGEWSTVLPSGVMKESGIYYFLITQAKKAKLFKISID
ncbi:MAG: hypothetical protein J7J72_02965 [Bacteroidales bacterium]|nr:hypothetical protein [Bacteroidales bacterium]